MSSLHDGFSSQTFDPVAAPFRGFRAFLIDDFARRDMPSVRRKALPPATFRASRGMNAEGRYLTGTLRGIFKTNYVWGPDVNEAICMRVGGSIRPHEGGGIDQGCNCGFWAYTNGEHYLSVGGPAALGVVEGWGRMVIGPHGFRAEKARIVALTFPKPGDDTDADQATVEVNGGLYDVVARLFGNVADRLLAKAGLASPTTAPVRVARAAHPWEKVTANLKAQVLELYPDVQVFGSVADMQAAFPLTDTSQLLPGPDGD